MATKHYKACIRKMAGKLATYIQMTVEKGVFISHKTKLNKPTDMLARKHLLHDVGLINFLSSVLQETKPDL